MTQTHSNISKFNLFFLFISIVWEPVQRYYLKVDGEGRIMTLLIVLAIVLNLVRRQNKKNLILYPAIACWTILVAYSMINSLVKGYYGELRFIVFLKSNFWEPYVVLWIAIVELMQDKKRCLRCILTALVIYMIIGSLHFNARDNDRIIAEGLGNSLPLRAMVALFVSSVLYLDKKLKRKSFIAVVLLSVFIIIITATRKALGAGIIILIGTTLGKLKKLNVKNVVIICLVAFIFLKGIGLIMNNTYMGQRIKEGNEGIYVSLSSNAKINELLIMVLGDRAVQYYDGFVLHRQAPWTGIGIENFQTIAQSDFRLHTEYMVHYCENGIIGFVLLLYYYHLLFKGIKKKRKKGENMWLCLFGLYSILFINFTAWTYSNTGVMFMYAIILTQIYSKETKPENENCYSS